MSSAVTETDIRLGESEQELALAETQAVLAAAASPVYREDLTELVEAIESGRLQGRHALTLEPILELALQAGRIRASTGRPARRRRSGSTASCRAARRCRRAPGR